MTTTTPAARLGAGAWPRPRGWNASLHMTAQERADAYVARSPIAVLAGHRL